MRYLQRNILSPFLKATTLIYFPDIIKRNTMSIADSQHVTFETLRFDNRTIRSLPIDTIKENYVREVKNACFSLIKPTPLKNPIMVVYSKEAMSLLDLNEDELNRKEAAEYLTGTKLMPGSETAAHCYCGHQFGVFAGQLGDGAAIYLGEVINKKGERWEIQLKGAGLTPYSRTADGRKVLRSTLREFLCSEAMHFLNIATTRAGSCVSSENTVIRDMFYDGNPKLEKCAVVLRIAPTFLRFGSFEIFKPLDRMTGGKGPSFGRNDILQTLYDFVCDNYFPEIVDEDKKIKYEKVFEEIVRRTAILVADWQCVGFVHGVLNTDNMSILGLTIDYGPYGFLDRYDPDYIFNSSDTLGRYTYKNQPSICEWNCKKLAEVLVHLIELSRSQDIIKNTFKKEYEKHYSKQMSKKLGLFTINEGDKKLIEELFEVMYETGADFTNSFRKLSLINLNGRSEIKNDVMNYLQIILQECSPIEETKEFYKPKFPKDTFDKLLEAIETQPNILNYLGLSETVVQNEVRFREKYEKIKNFTQQDKAKADGELWSTWLNKYLNRVYDEIESDSNFDIKKRIEKMNSVNPRFILRNHIAQDSIVNAEANRFTEAKMLTKILENPFSEESIERILSDFGETDKSVIQHRSKSGFYEQPPEIKKCVKLSCSS